MPASQTRAQRAWAALPDEAYESWCAYAQSLAAPSPRTGLTVAPRPDNLFTAHYSPMLLVDPTALPPETPPSQAFFGDVVAIAVTGGATGVTFTATAPNTAGVVTFTSSGLARTVPLEAGWYACAYRFIKASIGQVTELAQIDVVLVS